MNIGSSKLQPLSSEQSNPILAGMQRGLQVHLQQLQNKKAKAQLPYAGPQSAANLQRTQLQNEGTQAQLPYKGPQAAASLEATQLKNTLQQIINHYMPQQQEAQIGQKNAMSQFYKMGGPRAGVAIANQNAFMKNVGLDNPQLNGDPTKIREAANAYQQGKSSLPDGSKLNPMSPNTVSALATVMKGNSTAALVTKAVQANQSEAELQVMSSMAQKDAAPYATTYAGYSPHQILDTFKDDDKSQKQLGNFIASQAAQYEIAQQRNRVAQGAPGVGATRELMSESMQHIQSSYPRLSGKARKAAADRLNDYFTAGLQARNAVGISPTLLIPGATGMNTSNTPGEPKNGPQIGDVVKGYTYIGGPPHDKSSWSKN